MLTFVHPSNFRCLMQEYSEDAGVSGSSTHVRARLKVLTLDAHKNNEQRLCSRPARNAAELKRGRTSIYNVLHAYSKECFEKALASKNRCAASATASVTLVPAPKDQKPCRLLHGPLAIEHHPFFS
jgi:hypothetical protein